MNSLIFILLAFPLFVSSQNTADTTIKTRAKVGFVMSGGGAKGFAYIGLIKVMHEAGLEVDYVAGSSIGSIIAGLYALGYHADSMASNIRKQNWDALLTDQVDRKFLAFEEKEFGENSIISFPFNSGNVSIQAALFEGQEINLLLSRFYSPAYKTRNFCDLETPFLCIGTDLITGEAVVLDTGYLPMAVRASMSIPGYFSPTLYNGRFLVDGGVVDNYPVAVVKDKGMQFILGGDVQSGLVGSIDYLNNIPAIINQLISFNRVNANNIGIKLTNLHVLFPMSFGMMEFNSYDSIIALGERVARAHYDEIKALADSLNAIEFKPLKKYETVPLDSVFVDRVIIKGYERIPKDYFENIFGDFENSWVMLDDLENTIRRVYGTKYFAHIFYELSYKNDSTDLLINIREANPGYLSVAVNYNNDYSVSALLNGVFRNVVGKGTKIFTNLAIGPNPRLRMLFMKDNGIRPGFGAKVDMYYFGWNQYDSDVDPGALTGRIYFTNLTASLFAKSIMKNKRIFRIGGTYEYFRFKSRLEGSLDDSITNFNSFGDVFFSFNSDTRDRSHFATRGVKSELNVSYVVPLSKNWVRDLFSNSLIAWFDFERSIPFSAKVVLKPGIFLGGTFAKGYPFSSDKSHENYQGPPVQHWFFMGGQMETNYIPTFQSFTGVQFSQQQGYYMAILKTNLQYNFYRSFFLTFKGNIGSNQWFASDIFKSKNLVAGYGATLSWNSLIGPIEASVMGSNIYSGPSFFFNLGFWF